MPVVMANLRTAFSRAGPVAARMIAFFPGEIGRTVIFGSGQNVMPVRLVATSVHRIAIFVQSRSFDDVRVYVKLVEVDGDQLTSGVIPGARSDTVPSRDAASFFNLGAEICPPRAVAIFHGPPARGLIASCGYHGYGNGGAICPRPIKLHLVCSKTVQQPGAAGACEIFLAAASRSMRGGP